MARILSSLRKLHGGGCNTIWKQCFRNECSGTIGFIGLGNMGGPMALNLLQSNHNVIAFDVIEACTKPVAAAGAEIAETPADVAKKSSQIFTMLPNSRHVEDVYLGEHGILKSVQAGSLLIDSSTIDPAVSKKVSAEAAHKSATYVDAPVSGGVGAAKAATLTFMVGGETDDFQRASKLLEHVGKNLVHCGPVGTGQAAKICNNMLLAISMIGASEAMNLGINLGLDPKVLAGIINTSSGRCWASDTYNPVPGVLEGVPSSNNYQGGFGSALMYKDLGLSQLAASDTNSPTPFGAAALQMYRLICLHGHGPMDFSSVYQFIKSQQDKQ